MRNFFFLIVFITVGFNAQQQTNTIKNSVLPDLYPNQTVAGKKEGKWVFWYNKDWKQTTIKDSTHYYRKITFKMDVPQGKVYDYFLSGQVQWEGYLLAMLPKEVNDGVGIWYYENGNKKIEENFKNGLLEGRSISYYENGSINEALNYKNGKEEGEIKGYYPNGNIKVIGQYNSGERNGKWKWYKEDGYIDVEKDYDLLSWEEQNQKFIKEYNEGNYEKAHDYAKQALKQAKTEFGENHKNYGISLNNLASLYESMGRYSDALPLYQEALLNAEKSLGKEHASYGTYLNNLAGLYKSMGRYSDALPLYQEALVNAEKSLGKEHSEYGNRLNNLALLYKSMGRYSDALPLYQEALLNAEKSLGKEHASYGTYLNNLAGLYKSMGRYSDALPLYQEALVNAEKSLGKEHSEYGISLNNLASLYESMGRYSDALPLYQEALLNAEKSLGKEHASYGTYLNNLAGLYKSMGRYSDALPLYQEALVNAEKSLGKEHPEYGNRLNNLASLYQSMGKYSEALPLYQEALVNTGKSLGKEHHEYGVRLNNLALLYADRGRYSEALPLYQEALLNTEKSLGKEHPDYGIRLNNLAGLYKSMGRYSDALPLYQEALVNAEKSLGKDHASYGVRLNNLALLYADRGRYSEALPLCQEALLNTEKSLGKDHPSYGVVLKNLAGLYQRMGRYSDALPLYQNAIANGFINLNTTIPTLSERAKERYFTTLSDSFETYLSFFSSYYPTNQSVSENSYNIDLALKGMILQSGIKTRNTIIKSNDKNALAKYDEWITLKSELAQQYGKPISERISNLKEVERQGEKLEEELSRFSVAFGMASQIGKTTWQSIQNRLQENEVAIEFSSFRVFDGSQWTDTIQYTALVLKKNDSRPQLISLFTQKQLDELLTQTGSGTTRVQNLYRGSEGNDTGQHDLQKLYSLIWKPIETYLKTGDTVYFSPSGTLNQIAFAAITTPSGKYLSDLYDLRQVSTTAKLLEPQEKIKLDYLALFGGINYDESQEALSAAAKNINGKENFVSRALDTDLQRGGETWNYLKGTMSEVEDIKAIAEKEKLEVGYYTGNKALEEQFKALSGKNSPEILHIATHGFFFPDPQKSKEELNKLPIGGEKQNMFKLSDNPLNRSGLVFAGGNHTWKGEPVKPGMEDGILTAYEVSNVSLFNTQLVVLSACDTGLGDIKGSEGVYGLQRSFKIAGAQYLMMSLWQVPDKETAEFMNSFYQTLFKNRTIEESYHATQAYMKGKYPKDPYKWAAFVLVR